LGEVAAPVHKTLPGLHTREDASLDGRDLLRDEPGLAVAVVSTCGNVDIASNEIVTHDAVPVASDAVQDVIMSHIEVAVASDAVQDVVTPPIEMAADANVVRPVIVKKRIQVQKVLASVVKTTSGLVKLAAKVPSHVIDKKRIRMRKVSASVLKTISGFELIDDSCLDGKELRQVEPGEVDENDKDIGGRWIIKDGLSACTGDPAETCSKWVNNPKNVNQETTKSLTYIDSGNSSVGFVNS